MKKKSNLIIIICLVMLSLSGLLFLAESRADGASIQSIGDALWYMIVTLTTVGYGDLYPVTVLGKFIGVLFILSSMGLLGAILASMISIFNSGVIPTLYLRMHRKEEWFVFSQYNEKTSVLISDLKNSHKGLFICLGENKADEDNGILHLDYSFEKIIDLKPDKYRLHLFFMKDCNNDYENYSDFYNACSRHISDNQLPFYCYCLTEYVPEEIPVNLICFNKYENISRLYWNTYPLSTKTPGDEKIVLIGSGKFSSYILEHALERNVMKPVQSVEYHMFGDFEEFKNEHYRLNEYFSIDKKDNNRDSLFFHDVSWMQQKEIFESASRIIICDDDEKSNLFVLSNIRKYFVLRNTDAQIHVLFSQKITDTGVKTFGTTKDIYSEEYVLKRKLSRIAMDMHSVYQIENKGACEWNQLSEFKRQSNLAVADHMDIKIGLLNAVSAGDAYCKYWELPEDEKIKLWHLEHDRWMRFHIVNNWHFAEKRNDALREHNLIVPFEELPYEEQKKDAYAWELMEKM
ncbi:MAG: potassium channel family protein [Butyrivibrio sp.]|nr:potassium channel family protein [Butyrivibrio sp.]